MLAPRITRLAAIQSLLATSAEKIDSGRMGIAENGVRPANPTRDWLNPQLSFMRCSQDPVIDAIEVVALAHQPGHEVVVRKIGVEGSASPAGCPSIAGGRKGFHSPLFLSTRDAAGMCSSADGRAFSQRRAWTRSSAPAWRSLVASGTPTSPLSPGCCGKYRLDARKDVHHGLKPDELSSLWHDESRALLQRRVFPQPA